MDAESEGKFSIDFHHENEECAEHIDRSEEWGEWWLRIEGEGTVDFTKKAGLRGFIGDHELVLNRMKLFIRYKQLVSEIKHFLVPFISKTEKNFVLTCRWRWCHQCIVNEWYSKLDRSAFQLLTARGWPVLGRNYCPWGDRLFGGRFDSFLGLGSRCC